jgi:hypothetical protein
VGGGPRRIHVLIVSAIDAASMSSIRVGTSRVWTPGSPMDYQVLEAPPRMTLGFHPIFHDAWKMSYLDLGSREYQPILTHTVSNTWNGKSLGHGQKLTGQVRFEGDREYTMYEIATMTRAAPARLLGLKDRGHLAPGAAADIVVYREQEDVEEMFARPEFVFKDGTLVARDGRIVEVTWGNTHVVRPEYDPAIEKQLKPYFDRYHSIRMENFKIHDDELCECGHGSKAMPHDCRYKRVR